MLAPLHTLIRAVPWSARTVLFAAVALAAVLVALVLPAAGPDSMPPRVWAQSEPATSTPTGTATPTNTPIPEPTATTCGSSPLQGRTQKVVDAIVVAVSGITDCASVTAAHLAAVTFLNLGNNSLTSLRSGDFAGLTGLQWL